MKKLLRHFALPVVLFTSLGLSACSNAEQPPVNTGAVVPKDTLKVLHENSNGDAYDKALLELQTASLNSLKSLKLSDGTIAADKYSVRSVDIYSAKDLNDLNIPTSAEEILVFQPICTADEGAVLFDDVSHWCGVNQEKRTVWIYSVGSETTSNFKYEARSADDLKLFVVHFQKK